MKAWTLAAGLVLVAASSEGFEATCANGITWEGPSVAECPCCEVCDDGSWIVTGLGRCPTTPATRSAAPRPDAISVSPEGSRREYDPSRRRDEASATEIAFFASAALLAAGLGLFLYFLPAWIAFRRGHGDRWGVLILNFFAGWTIVAWIAALIWAATGVRGRESSPT